MKPLRRLRDLCAILARQQNAPWQIEAMAHTAWPEIWHGERGVAGDAVARQTALAEHVRQLNALQSAAVYAAASGDFERGASLDRGTAAALESLQLPTLSRTWRRLTGVLASGAGRPRGRMACLRADVAGVGC